MKMNELYQKILQSIRNADAVLIGASNGLSISEGYNIFADDAWFQETFGDFRSKYGIRSVLQGTFFGYPTEEEKWTFFARLISKKCYLEKPSQMMLDLYELVHEKDYFVITSNGEDHFVPAGFSREKVFELEGRMTLFRCGANCCGDTKENKEEILRLAKAEQKGPLSPVLVPRCVKCGAPMTINLADQPAFFETDDYQKNVQAYRNFLRKYHNRNLVILELGIGRNNRMIKAPLMRLAGSEPHAVYITFNKGELYIAPEIQKKSIGVDGDIAGALNAIRSLGGI